MLRLDEQPVVVIGLPSLPGLGWVEGWGREEAGE
jgi:hypothetical protein